MALLDKFRKQKEKEKDFLELGEALDESKGSDYGPAGDINIKKPEPLPVPEPTESFLKKDLDVLNLKLSAIASEMEALKQRVRFVEGKLGLRPDESPVKSQPKEEQWHY